MINCTIYFAHPRKTLANLIFAERLVLSLPVRLSVSTEVPAVNSNVPNVYTSTIITHKKQDND